MLDDACRDYAIAWSRHAALESPGFEIAAHLGPLRPDTRREAVGVLDRSSVSACYIRATRMEEAANHP